MNPGERVLLRADIRHERDVVLVRQRARQLAGLLGFDTQDQTRLATAVSEIARNAFEYAGGGQVAFGLTTGHPSSLQVRISDEGPGIPRLTEIFEGRYQSSTGMGLGILGARRLVDRFDIGPGAAGGTEVTLAKTLPAGAAPSREEVVEMTRVLLASSPDDPFGELQAQNHELLLALDGLRARQVEVERLNSELHETNRGVLALYAELDDRALQLGKASELKTHFLSNISHELRTPLNAILNLSRLLLQRMDGDLGPEQERQVTMISRAAGTLSNMVNDLLDLARIEAGKSVVRTAEFQVDDMLAGLRGMLRPLITSDAVALVVDHSEPGLAMQSDEGKVSQVLRNLVSNSIKFTPAGEVRVSLRHDPGSDMVEFRVTDTGIGIAAGDLERVFEEYSQVEHSLQGKAVGSGLGLPLSRRLAALLGGTLTATSVPGEGSTFTLQVPRVYRPPVPDDPDPPVIERTAAGKRSVSHA